MRSSHNVGWSLSGERWRSVVSFINVPLTTATLLAVEKQKARSQQALAEAL
jgi:hypothetical protein